MQRPVNPIEFQRKWIGIDLTERSASQQHFLDLCRVLNHPAPADLDGTGDFFTFERGAAKSTGGNGWADVWYRGHFAWEYKGPHKDLVKAYDQLLRYKDDLENPPLLIVSDLDTIEIHTNFTATPKKVHRITLHTFADAASQNLLQRSFTIRTRSSPRSRWRKSPRTLPAGSAPLPRPCRAAGKTRTGLRIT